MLSIAYLRENKEEAIERLSKRFFNKVELVENAIQLDKERRETQKTLDDNLGSANQLSKQIGQWMKEGNKAEAESAKAEVSSLKEQISTLEASLKETEKQLQDILYLIPNVPHFSVKQGRSAEDNEIVGESGVIPTLHEGAIPHWDLTTKYNLIDFELGVKITGAGFPVYIGKGARLQRALINFFLEEALNAGYTEIQPPVVINEASGYGTGQLPDKEGQMYYMPADDLYMIPTAEVPLTNLYRDVILKESDFPIKMTGYTPCFRREAGSYGKDVRGLNRLHQFDKVEIVQIQHPSKSYQTLEDMKDYVGSLLDKLGLPYRILRLCGGDMGFTSALTYDFEVYSTAQERWLEVSSVSNFETFQANRLKLRFKDESGKTQMAHTLNGSALALPRIVASILENYQTAEGINIPEVLIPYTGFDKID
jgi:seryl-tRNA synthetase